MMTNNYKKMDKISEISELKLDSTRSYAAEIEKIKRSDGIPEEKLSLLDLLLKDFFRKRFHFKKNTEYSEMIEIFLEKNKPELAVFCHDLIRRLYSGDPLDQDTISVLLENSTIMIENELHTIEIKSKVKKSFSFLFKKKPPIADNSANVSRQVEKEIDKKIPSEARYNKITSELTPDNKKVRNVDDLREKLDLSIIDEAGKNQENSSTIEDENKSIENIDNLDRIKEKIKKRKIELRKEKENRED